MITAALVLHPLYLSLGFGLRTWIQWLRTGDTGFPGHVGLGRLPLLSAMGVTSHGT